MLNSVSQHIVIVGAGHAGGSAAVFLRQYGFQGKVTLLGEEALPPYQRPPLSKQWLQGKAEEEDLLLKSIDYYTEHGIDFRAVAKVVKLDRAAKSLLLKSGAIVAYDQLILATGARNLALPVPGGDLAGVLSLRTAEDAERIKAILSPGKRLAVIGGGYIGLEVAATGRGLGAEVTVLEREARLLSRVACEPLASFFRDVHEGHRVRFEFGATVVELLGEAGHVVAIRLGDGRILPCDAAVVGIGAYPNEELGKEAGLQCARGIVVDLDARTSDPNIFAIGDVSYRPMPLYDRMFRMESVPNALEQARQAACAITGKPAPPGEVPWQWSDQYDLKLQIAGYAFDSDSIVLRGTPSVDGFSIFHLKGTQIQSLEAVNAPADFMVGRRMIGARTQVDPQKLADRTIPMKEIAA